MTPGIVLHYVFVLPLGYRSFKVTPMADDDLRHYYTMHMGVVCVQGLEMMVTALGLPSYKAFQALLIFIGTVVPLQLVAAYLISGDGAVVIGILGVALIGLLYTAEQISFMSLGFVIICLSLY
ncbi:hypothetical protein KIPB_013304 [Kipferlia bialata]|uniref:Uncharacterized protein n=1 Tax=Kipferlia bialata TaxID=797122 RepID=A0A9K3GPF9_9EUKA|nr:hypothetical protein KIPB_013304 [Kipferlia bialata]|eukprot:g13304.t1